MRELNFYPVPSSLFGSGWVICSGLHQVTLTLTPSLFQTGEDLIEFLSGHSVLRIIFFKFVYVFTWCVCVCVQRTTFESLFFPSTMQVPGIDFRLLGQHKVSLLAEPACHPYYTLFFLLLLLLLKIDFIQYILIIVPPPQLFSDIQPTQIHTLFSLSHQKTNKHLK